jgi:coenzyme F420-reducing hydrogenase alpha subunit
MSHKLTGDSHVMHVGTLARVEGEGAMHIEYHDGVVTDVQLRIYEPPRFYEAFLRGRAHTEPPDITARICGICPVAYQMSSCWAIEDACGVEVTEDILLLRRLLYCGEWIESHALHVFLLHAPDFLGYDGAIEMAADHPDVVERGLRMKKAGNDLMDAVGGRSIHPVNVRVGGFYRMPTAPELRTLRPRLERARDDALETVKLVSGFDFPDLEQPYEYLSLRADREWYPIESGSVVTSSGASFPVRDFTSHIEEFHVAHSNALHARLDGSTEPYVVGPLARYSLNSDRLGEAARAAASEAGLGPTCRNPFRSIVVRAVELVEAYSEALRIIDGWTGAAAPNVPVPPREGEGFGASEAPRGTLFHRYVIDDTGIIQDAQIVPPTSQNQRSVEEDLRTMAQQWSDLDDHALLHRCEQAIRNYDPCISCATHFLDLTVDRR